MTSIDPATAREGAATEATFERLRSRDATSAGNRYLIVKPGQRYLDVDDDLSHQEHEQQPDAPNGELVQALHGPRRQA